MVLVGYVLVLRKLPRIFYSVGLKSFAYTHIRFVEREIGRLGSSWLLQGYLVSSGKLGAGGSILQKLEVFIDCVRVPLVRFFVLFTQSL